MGLQRAFPADTLVWRDGIAQWLPASQVTELATVFGGGGPIGYEPAAQPAAYTPAPGQYGQGQGQYGQAGSPLGYAQPPSAYGYNGYQYGGFWWRVLAYIIDYVLLAIVNVPVSLLVGSGSTFIPVGGRGGAGNPFAAFANNANLGLTMLGWAIQIAIGWLYFAAQESSTHQATLGKRACGLIVTDLTGQRLSFGRATGRYFGKVLSVAICYIGVIMVAFTDKKQGLHDQMASTLVWKKP